ncbi:regulatory protein RecX [Pseudonocardia saturnea]
MSGDPGGSRTSPVRVARFDDAGAEAAPAAQTRFDMIGADAEPAAAVADFAGAHPAPDDTVPDDTAPDEAAPVAEFDLADGSRPGAARTARFGDAARGGRSGARSGQATPSARPDPAPSDGEGPEKSGFGGRSPRGRAATRRAAAEAVDRAGGTADGPATERPADTPPAPRRGFGPKQVSPDADPVTAAREICLRLLTDRSRTRHELAQALTKRGVPADAADTVLSRFDEVGLIDDAAFAGQFVRSRHNQRGLARRAIAMELRRKGVDDEVAGEALEEVDDDAEAQRARELVDRKLRTVPADTPEQRTKAATRLVGMLARKGYGGGIAYRVVREALAARGAEIDELGADPVD